MKKDTKIDFNSQFNRQENKLNTELICKFPNTK